MEEEYLEMKIHHVIIRHIQRAGKHYIQCLSDVPGLYKKCLYCRNWVRITSWRDVHKHFPLCIGRKSLNDKKTSPEKCFRFSKTEAKRLHRWLLEGK